MDVEELVPSRTLSEAATIATCYSTAWEAKITSSVWWVWHYQVIQLVVNSVFSNYGYRYPRLLLVENT